jgi:hypothetical protein
MKWEIRGTRNGKPGQWKLEAGSAEDARTKATVAGVIVQWVAQMNAPLPDPQSISAPMPPPVWQEPAFVNSPPIRPVLPLASYSAEKDPVIWLIGAVAILLSLLIWSPQLNFSNAAQLGYLLGAVVGAFVVVFLPGLIGAKLAGKRPVPARVGFSVAAFLVLVVTALGEQHLRQHNIEDATNMGQALLSDVRAAAHTGASSRHASADPSSPTMNDLSASEAADAKVLMTEMQKFVHEAKTVGDGWIARTRAIIGEGIIRPQDLDSAAHIASTRERLKQLRQVIDDRAKGTDALYDSLPNRVRPLPIGSVMKESALASYAQNVKKTQGITHQITEVDREFVTAATDLADFMEGRLGHFKVVGKKFLFENDADVADYNADIARVRQAATSEGELTAKQQKFAQESSDTMEQFMGKK